MFHAHGVAGEGGKGSEAAEVELVVVALFAAGNEDNDDFYAVVLAGEDHGFFAVANE